MRFMVLVHPGNRKQYEAGLVFDEKLMAEMAEMGKFNEKLVDAGVMQIGEGLHPSSKGVRLHFPGKGQTPVVTQGPFPDSLVGGFWIWEVKSKDEALEWAKRAPMEDGATLELRQIFESSDFGPEVEEQENKLREKIANQQRR